MKTLFENYGAAYYDEARVHERDAEVNHIGAEKLKQSSLNKMVFDGNNVVSIKRGNGFMGRAASWIDDNVFSLVRQLSFSEAAKEKAGHFCKQVSGATTQVLNEAQKYDTVKGPGDDIDVGHIEHDIREIVKRVERRTRERKPMRLGFVNSVLEDIKKISGEIPQARIQGIPPPVDHNRAKNMEPHTPTPAPIQHLPEKVTFNNNAAGIDMGLPPPISIQKQNLETEKFTLKAKVIKMAHEDIANAATEKESTIKTEWDKLLNGRTKNRASVMFSYAQFGHDDETNEGVRVSEGLLKEQTTSVITENRKRYEVLYEEKMGNRVEEHYRAMADHIESRDGKAKPREWDDKKELKGAAYEVATIFETDVINALTTQLEEMKVANQ